MILRIRLINKHAVYIDLFKQSDVDKAIKSLYLLTDAAKKAMPNTSTKAAAINYCLGLARYRHKADDSNIWEDADIIERLLNRDLCILSTSFKGVDPTNNYNNFLFTISIKKAKKNLKKTYSPIFLSDAFSCYCSHFTTFYSARSNSILTEAS